MKPVMESPWVTLGNWKAGLLGAEGLMRERGDYQSPGETRRAHSGWEAVPRELTDVTSRCLLTSSPEAWWPFQDEPHPRRAEGAREDQQNRDWRRKSWRIVGTCPVGPRPAAGSVQTPYQPHPRRKGGRPPDQREVHRQSPSALLDFWSLTSMAHNSNPWKNSQIPTTT